MSTRGCVAVKTEEGWRGIYNHYDSYPTGLGRELWEELEEVDSNDFSENLIEFTDWREYLNDGVCKYCGKKGLGQLVSISAKITGFDRDYDEDSSLGIDEEIKEKIEETGYPDPEAEYHEHTLDGDITVEDQQITHREPDPLFVEWVYVVDPEQEKMIILTHKSVEREPGQEPYEGDGYEEIEPGVFDYGHCIYKHVKLAEVPLNGEEPNWQTIENLVRAELTDREPESDEGEMAEMFKGETVACSFCGGPIPKKDLEDPDDNYVNIAHKACFNEKLEEFDADIQM